MSAKTFPDFESARKVALSLTYDRNDGEQIARMMFEASERGENACFLHQSSIFYGNECICSRCSPGAARGLFAGYASI